MERHLAGVVACNVMNWRAQNSSVFSDERIAELCDIMAADVRSLRLKYELVPTYRMVDTCAAEFEAFTPYLYSSYDGVGNAFAVSDADESPPTKKKKVVILGSGPNRIGQGIEFDYCCVQAVLALREAGVEAIMINCNPENGEY